MKRMRLGKKGVTLTEVVISLALIALIMSTVLTIVFNSIKVQAKMINRTEAQNFVADALECFKIADTKDEFEQALTYAVGDGSFVENGSEYIFKRSDVTATVVVDYDGEYRPYFLASVKEDLSDEILSLTYEKAESEEEEGGL